MVVGAWGGDGGSSWDDGSYSGVRGITIVYDRCIDWIRVVYDKNGKPVTGQKHGGVGGNKTAEVEAGSVLIFPFSIFAFSFVLPNNITYKQ